MKKRIFSGFLSVVLVLSLLPWSAVAADEQVLSAEENQAEERQEQDPGVPVTLPADPGTALPVAITPDPQEDEQEQETQPEQEPEQQAPEQEPDQAPANQPQEDEDDFQAPPQEEETPSEEEQTSEIPEVPEVPEVLSQTQAIPVALEEEHTHYLCGGDSCTEVGDHTDTNTTFTAWNETDRLPDTVGSYYLIKDVTLSSTWEPVSGTVLCLNGKTIQAGGNFDTITIDNDIEFTLTDCGDNGKITHTSGYGRGVLVEGTAVFNMYGGDITRNTSSKEGAGVNALGTFNMYGGSITSNTMSADSNYSGGGVCVDSVYSGTGEVHNHIFNLYNGRISDNRSKNGGGGIELGTYGELYMHDGSIFNNESSSGGGGVSVSSSNKFVMTGGSITGNICGAKYNGGGVAVYSKDPVFTVSGNVTITGNKRGTETNNVFLHDTIAYWGSYISVLGIGDAGLASTAQIGITTEIEPTSSRNMPAVFQNDTDYSANFFSDAGHYVVYNSKTKQLELSLTEPGHTHYLCGGKTCVGGHTDDPTTFVTPISGIGDLMGSNYSNLKHISTGRYYLTGNLDLGDNTLDIDDGDVTICLNGYSITSAREYAVSVSRSKLTLCDCKGGGKITGKSGGVNVYSGGSFTMYGGEITGNMEKGGVRVEAGGIEPGYHATFTMHGGKITGNTAVKGGGVYVGDNCTFTMTGGEITGNTAAENGGGVYIDISGGVGSVTPDVNVSNSAKIVENTVNVKVNNIYLSNGVTIAVADDLGNAAKIGVTAQNAAVGTLIAKPATGVTLTNDDAAKFTSDNTSYNIILSNGNMVLGKKDSDHNHIWDEFALDPKDNSRIIMHCSVRNCTATGGSVTVKAPTKRTYSGTPPCATVETSADWLGVEVSNIPIRYTKRLDNGHWATLDRTPYTGTGTHRAYIQMYSAGGITVEAYVEYTLTEITKNDVSNEIKFDDGKLTYTGSGLTYEKATIGEGYNGKFTYTYGVPKGGSTGELDANGLPLAVGYYTVIATYEDDENYGTARAGLEVVAGTNSSGSSSSGGGGGGRTSYSVNTPSKSDNGTVTTSPKNAASGSTVTITVKPDEGYVLDTLVVTDNKGNTVKTTDKGDGKFSFTMPSGQVDVKATFTKAEEEISPFGDVDSNDYYYDAVKWAAAQGVTGGTGNGKFSPADACTRAQIVTFLWRTAGSPQPKGMSSFTDVPADAYYAKAVAWAVENGITAGTAADKFSPDAPCTRAHAVTFLWRAAGSPAVQGGTGFQDVASSDYFAAAVAWAKANDITDGVGNGLFGSMNSCTRAQIVTFLYRVFGEQ